MSALCLAHFQTSFVELKLAYVLPFSTPAQFKLREKISFVMISPLLMSENLHIFIILIYYLIIESKSCVYHNVNYSKSLSSKKKAWRSYNQSWI